MNKNEIFKKGLIECAPEMRKMLIFYCKNMIDINKETYSAYRVKFFKEEAIQQCIDLIVRASNGKKWEKILEDYGIND